MNKRDGYPLLPTLRSALCLAALVIASGCFATGGATRRGGEEPVADLVLSLSQAVGATPAYSDDGEQSLKRATNSQIEAYIASRFSAEKRGFIRFRIEKATHGGRTSDEVTAIANELARWGQVLGFVHGEICLDVGYMDLQNPRAVIKYW